MNRLVRVKFRRSVDRGALPSVEHCTMRVVTRRRVYLLGFSWCDRNGGSTFSTSPETPDSGG